MHYVDGQCVYVYKIQFARCKPCDGQNRVPVLQAHGAARQQGYFRRPEGKPTGRQYDGAGR